MMIIPFGFFKQPVSGVSPLYDNISVVYSLRRLDMTTLWTNACLKIRRDSDNATAFVFFDGSSVDDTITLSSLISTTSDTTPDATTLTTWVGANGAFVERWYGITDDNTISTGKRAIQTTTGNQPKFITTGVIITKNSLPEIDFLSSTRYLDASTNTDLDNGNDFSIFTVSYQDEGTTSTNFTVLVTSLATSNRILLFCDRRTNKKSFRIITPGTNGEFDLSAQLDSSDQRLLTLITSSSSGTSYLNGASQTTDSWTNSYDNDVFRIGVSSSVGNPLWGGIQEIIIFPSDKSADRTTIESEIDTYYSIP